MHSISQLYGFTISRYSTSPISNFRNPIATLPALVATMIRATHTRTHYTDDDTDTPSQPSRTLLVNRRLQKERSQSLEVRPRKKSDRAPSLTAPSHTRVTVARYSNCHDSCIRQVRTRAKLGRCRVHAIGVLPWPRGRSTRGVLLVAVVCSCAFVRGWVVVGCAERQWRVDF